MNEVVLDASALLAMLQDEPGGAKVAGVIASSRISAINYAEVVSHYIRLGMPEREVDAMLDPLPMTIVPADKALGQLAGRLGRPRQGVVGRQADERHHRVLGAVEPGAG